MFPGSCWATGIEDHLAVLYEIHGTRLRFDGTHHHLHNSVIALLLTVLPDLRHLIADHRHRIALPGDLPFKVSIDREGSLMTLHRFAQTFLGLYQLFFSKGEATTLHP